MIRIDNRLRKNVRNAPLNISGRRTHLSTVESIDPQIYPSWMDLSDFVADNCKRDGCNTQRNVKTRSSRTNYMTGKPNPMHVKYRHTGNIPTVLTNVFNNNHRKSCEILPNDHDGLHDESLVPVNKHGITNKIKGMSCGHVKKFKRGQEQTCYNLYDQGMFPFYNSCNSSEKKELETLWDTSDAIPPHVFNLLVNGSHGDYVIDYGRELRNGTQAIPRHSYFREDGTKTHCFFQAISSQAWALWKYRF